MTTNDDIKNRFTYHKPDENQVADIKKIREQCKFVAEAINMRCPDSREKSLALTKLEEVSMWTNASIARHWPNGDRK